MIAPSALPVLSATLFRWLAFAVWRQQPGALLAAVVAIAMGVALGLGINLVNRSALSEFDDALARVNGQAQFRLIGTTASIPDSALAAVERLPAVAAASPVIETRLSVLDGQGRSQDLTVLGLDVFRAAAVAPALLPRPGQDNGAGSGGAGSGGAASALFDDDAIFLSAALARRLSVAVGDPLRVQINGREHELRVAGDVPGADAGLPIAVMDIGAAQFVLAWLDRLSRIDLRLTDGAQAEAVLAQIRAMDPAFASVQMVRPDEAGRRMSNLSRAYRINLNVLALVALLTGGFIVYASMELAVLRMMPMLALLGVLGARPILRSLLVGRLALLIGLAGSALGIALGIGLAALLLGLVGGDLGGGYFSANRPPLDLSVPAIALFGLLGIVAALAGALSPALRLRRLVPAAALRAGQAVQLGGLVAPLGFSVTLAAIGAALLALPAIAGLPLAAYLAIACWLFAGVLVVAPLLGWTAHGLAQWVRHWRAPMIGLAAARLDHAHRNTFPALAGVVASFALVSAMAIMVNSFRMSVDQWLDTVLPADVYLRVPTTGARAGLDDAAQAQIATLPGVARASFLRSIDLTLSPGQPTLALIARPIDRRNPAASLPLTGRSIDPQTLPPGCIPIWISEPAANRLDWAVGERLDLPLPIITTSTPCLMVTGIWRDYARQHGAIMIDQADYQSLTGDGSVSDAALWLAADARADSVMAQVRETLDSLPGIEMRSAGDIRALSLRIFDRSFAVTYALEAVALLVGLFGVATTWSGEALARTREFGMLRHLGVTRGRLVALFASESAFAISLSVLWGAGLGSAIAQVLIHRVNPQSFHWTMATHWPVGLLLGGGGALIGLGVITAIIAARRSAGQAPIAAVRVDW